MIKLNIASGPNLFPGWTNLDRVDQAGYMENLRGCEAFTGWPPGQVKLAEQIKAGAITSVVHDLREGFGAFADGSVDALYLGQIVEHLNPIYELPKLLAECARMLKPGAPLRITTPDLDLLIDAYKAGQMQRFAPEQPSWYLDAPPSAQLAYLMYGAGGPDCTRENYEGHMHLFTRQSLRVALLAAGLERIEFFYEAGASDYGETFAECVDCGMSHSFACEAVKP